MQNNSYKAAGVDVTAGYKAVELMKADVKRTHNSCVPEGIGGFSGLFIPDLAGMKEPVLVSGTDGVGTKLKLAQLLDKHDTVGIDLVAMCANDIICCGAKPLFFLDYINCGKNVPERIAEIVKGISEGCIKAGCALLGGETAEHPGITPDDEYDLAGFCVGVADKPKLIQKTAQEGDVLIGLASSGVHSNGFSLIRKVFDIENNPDKSLLEKLLTPTEMYVKPILALIEKVNVKGIANITGGGFYENIPRCLPEGVTAVIKKDSYKLSEIFTIIAERGNIPSVDMYGTFNMGIGMVAVVGRADAALAIETLAADNIKAYCIGEIVKGTELTII